LLFKRGCGMMQRFCSQALLSSNVFIWLSDMGCLGCFGPHVKLRSRKILPSLHVLNGSVWKNS
jgi:hypothetical protein